MTPSSEIKVMVVDDYEGMRMLVCRCLNDMGFTNVRLKPSADEALAALSAERFDLIISDYQMASGDGLHLLKSVRADPATRHIKFIMLTGSGDQEIVRDALVLGVDEYLTKPVEPRSLKEAISRHLMGSPLTPAPPTSRRGPRTANAPISAPRTSH